MTMLFGLMLAFSINYEVCFQNSDFQWRFAMLFQCVFAIYIAAVKIILQDTPRWLIRHEGPHDSGLVDLAKLRNMSSDHLLVHRTKDDIMEAIAIESKEEGT